VNEEQEIDRMALTRKFLAAMGIEEEKIDEIISAHTETVNALKEQRDSYKEAAEKLPKVEKEFNDYKESHSDDGENSFEAKYNTLKQEYNDYKKEVTAKETKAAKTGAYRAFLKTVGINDKRIDTVVKVAEANGTIDKIVLDSDGNITDKEALEATTKTEWADFIVTTNVNGANTATPPNNNGAVKKTKDEIFAIKNKQERLKAMAENKDLFL
jgi:hypothetical protein